MNWLLFIALVGWFFNPFTWETLLDEDWPVWVKLLVLPVYNVIAVPMFVGTVVYVFIVAPLWEYTSGLVRMRWEEKITFDKARFVKEYEEYIKSRKGQ